MRDSTPGNQALHRSPSPLRYLPATLVSGFLLALLLFAPYTSEWSLSACYGLFLKAKGPPPVSHTVALISAQPDHGTFDQESIAKLAKAILILRPKVMAVNLPAILPGETSTKADLPRQGAVVLAHGFRAFKAWTFSDAAVKSYPGLLSNSLYPTLDRPGQGLILPMGEGMEISDSLLKWPAATTGFSWPVGKPNVYAVPAFARLGRGVVANLGVESARRYLGIEPEKIEYLKGVGLLFNSSHILPVDERGRMFLRFHSPGGIPRLKASDILAGKLPSEAIKGKIVFLDAVETGTPGMHTVAGPRSATEIWAEAATGLLEDSLVQAPAWEGILSVTLGLVFAGLVILALVLDFGAGAALGLSLLLACLYPAIAFVVFMKFSWWLPPTLPPLMIAAAFIPFYTARLLMPSARKPAQSIPPAPAFDPVLVSGNYGQGRPNGSQSSSPVTPVRGIPRTVATPIIPAQAPAPGPAPRPEPPPRPSPGPAYPTRQVPTTQAPPRPPAPRERQDVMSQSFMPPPVAPAPRPPEPRYSDPRDPPIIDEAPTRQYPIPIDDAPVKPVPASPAPPVQVSSPSVEIERDAKGGLIRVGKYKIVRKMGFGSAGDVFEGFDTHMGRQVAIKTITKNATSHFDRAGERFVLEAKAAGSLNHPCINTVYDFGTIQEVSYMVLEFLDGITLSQWMRNHPVPPRPQTVANWLGQICSALDYAHGHKVIHRDLKPANLMIVNNGATIKLLDFGIAKMEDVGLTQTGMTVGTPSYMSPEQLSALKITAASDQYGMAVVIYQLLTYKLPYLGSKIPELCNRILKNDLIPITEFNPGLGEPFWLALRKALSRNPEDRYATCTEMCQALEAAFPAPDSV